MKNNFMSQSSDIYQTGYAHMNKIMEHSRLKLSLKLIQIISGKRKNIKILDAGCGDGLFTKAIGKTCHSQQLYGYDISQKAVKMAKKIGVKATAIKASQSTLPYHKDYFDLIFCGSILEIVSDPDQLLQELHRILKRNGYLVVTTPNLNSWASRLVMLFGYLPFYYRVSKEYDIDKINSHNAKTKSNGFIRLFNLKAFKNILILNKFKIIDVYGSPEDAWPKPISWIDRMFSLVPSLAFQLIIVAKK